MELVISEMGRTYEALFMIEGIPMMAEVYEVRSATWSGKQVSMIDIAFADAIGLRSNVETQGMYIPDDLGSYYKLLEFNNPVAAMSKVTTTIKGVVAKYEADHSDDLCLYTFSASSIKRNKLYERILRRMGMSNALLMDDAYSIDAKRVYATKTTMEVAQSILNNEVTRLL